MNILKAGLFGVLVLFAFAVVAVIAWAFVGGIISAWNYDVTFFSMPVIEWHGFWRVIAFLYALLAIWFSCLITIEAYEPKAQRSHADCESEQTWW